MGKRRTSGGPRNRDRDGLETSGARTKTSKIKHLHQSHDRPNRSARVRNTLLVGEPPSRRGIARADMADEANPSQKGISIPSGGRRAFWSRQIARTEAGSLFSDSLFHAKAQRGHVIALAIAREPLRHR